MKKVIKLLINTLLFFICIVQINTGCGTMRSSYRLYNPKIKGFEIVKSGFNRIDIFTIEKYDTNHYLDYNYYHENPKSSYPMAIEYKIGDYILWNTTTVVLDKKYRLKQDPFRDSRFFILFSQKNKITYFYPEIRFDWLELNSSFIYKNKTIFILNKHQATSGDNEVPPYYLEELVAFEINNPFNFKLLRLNDCEKIKLIEPKDSNLRIVVEELYRDSNIGNALLSTCAARVPKYLFYSKGQKEFILDENLNVISTNELELKNER